MAQLHQLERPIRVTLIHGLTGQQIENCTLDPSETDYLYEVEHQNLAAGVNGSDVETTILVRDNGTRQYFRYRTFDIPAISGQP